LDLSCTAGGNLAGYRECFEEAVGAALAGTTVLTANTRSARAIQAAAERQLRISNSAWLTPDVLPFGAFVERLYSDAVVAGAVDVQALQREQELQLWRQIIERSSSGREMLLPESAAALASESFRTAMEHKIALDSPLMTASSDTRAFSGWAAEFMRQLAAHRWTCPALFLREVAPRLSSLELSVQVYAFLADATPAQSDFLVALSEAGVRLSIAPKHEDTTAGIVVRYEFDGVADELRGAAQWARQQLEASPEARIGIIVFDLERKLSQVESAFRSVLHPEQLLGEPTPSVYEIASPLALDEYPAVRCALDLLSLFAAPVEFHSFHSMLSSPYLAAEPEAVARFVAEVRVRARRQVSWENFAKWLQESRELPGVRAALQALPKHSPFSSEQTAAYWADISRRILEAFGWPGVALESEEFQVTESWRELLASVSSLELLEWRSDFRGFARRLEHAAATQKFKPETLNAPVQIMSMVEAEGSVFDALWIGSCSDELWPDSPSHSPLIPTALLKAAGVAVVGSKQAEARIARITSRLLHSAPRVALSLARRSDDEREQRWSPLFAQLPAAAALLEKPLLPAQRFDSAMLETISDATAPALSPGEIARGGTSLLQEQSNCPFRAFAIRRLLAREALGPSEAMSAIEKGNIVDAALQLIWEELKDSEGSRRADRAAIIESSVDEAMAREWPSSDDQWSKRFRTLERQRMIELLTEWITLESSRKPFHVLGHQIAAEVNLGGLSLRGRLDRLDEIDGAQVVIDYKTGSCAVSAWQVPRPRLPQMPFYALAMQQQKLNLAGISFAVVRKGETAFKGYLREKDLLPCTDPAKRSFEGLTFDEYTGKWAEELERIGKSFVQGDAAVDPKIPPGRSGSTCEYCHLTPLCRIGELAASGTDREDEDESDE
jgi:ATP-dependent helicase/nuclease subunit B